MTLDATGNRYNCWPLAELLAFPTFRDSLFFPLAACVYPAVGLYPDF